MVDEDEDAVQFPSRTQKSGGWGSTSTGNLRGNTNFTARNDMEEDDIPFPSRKQGGGGFNRPATQ